MSLTYNPNKKITVEIDNVDPSGCRGYSIYHVRPTRDPRLIARDVDDGQVSELLSDRNWRRFTEKGIYKFTVYAERVTELFQYLP